VVDAEHYGELSGLETRVQALGATRRVLLTHSPTLHASPARWPSWPACSSAGGAHLMRRAARGAGLQLSVRELLTELAGIEETVLLYPSTGGRPRARRMLTEMSPTQRGLYDLFDLDRL